MRRFSPDDVIPDDAKGAAIALGNFDGVHLGHQGVIGAARAVALTSGVQLGAAAFEPHPIRLLRPETPPARLQTRDQRARALAAIGVKVLFKIRFDRELSQMTDAEFAERVLAGRIGASHVSVGFDFRFGRGRMGDVETLRAHGQRLGFTVSVVAPIDGADGGKVSSSAIRNALRAGEMEAAARMLGRPWAIEGVVQRGFQRGRTIGVPTANLALGDYLRPRFGVYAIRARIGDALIPGVASVGVNPTVGALSEPVLEAHLFDFDRDLYDQSIEIDLIAFLRDEAKFDSMDAMRTQITADIAQARAALG